MENLIVAARLLSADKPAPGTGKPAENVARAPSELVSHIMAAVVGAVVLAEMTNSRRCTTTVVVEPNIVIGGEDAPTNGG